MVAIRVSKIMRPKPRLLNVPKNVWNDVIAGKVGKIYIPDQEISKIALAGNVKGLKRERRDAKKNKKHAKKNRKHSKKLKVDPE